MPALRYVLITPARNEARFIELTLRSVVAQTLLPEKWVIISDGSTDGTDEIVCRYAATCPWIELVRMPERRERNFAGKVHAFNTGYARMRDINYEVVASLDADISFDQQYFAYLLGKLAEDSHLGLVGTPFVDDERTKYDYRYVNIEHVSGACQVFRRECFEHIGGYTPIKGGGIDYLAVITARMKGWKTRTFTGKVCLHHRVVGTAEGSLVRARFKYGKKDYAFGNHPLWECFRMIHQMARKPMIVGGGAVMAGYIWAMLARIKRPVSPELVAFVRREQMQRLKALIQQALPWHLAGSAPNQENVAVD
jgi:glycosyltransferase involved in cell wall biosynthesis